MHQHIISIQFQLPQHIIQSITSSSQTQIPNLKCNFKFQKQIKNPLNITYYHSHAFHHLNKFKHLDLKQRSHINQNTQHSTHFSTFKIPNFGPNTRSDTKNCSTPKR